MFVTYSSLKIIGKYHPNSAQLAQLLTLKIIQIQLPSKIQQYICYSILQIIVLIHQ